MALTQPVSAAALDYSQRADEDLVDSFRSLLAIPIGSVPALDTEGRPWHGLEAFGADRRFALKAGSEAAVANPPQCGGDVAQQVGLEVGAANRQISFRRVLNLIHWIRAFLDCDAIPRSQDLNQFGLFLFKDLLKSTQIA